MSISLTVDGEGLDGNEDERRFLQQVEEFQRTCDEVGEQTTERGLTEEKLVELLRGR